MQWILALFALALLAGCQAVKTSKVKPPPSLDRAERPSSQR